MDKISEKARSIWKSERLTYRAADPNDKELQAWFQTHMYDNPEMVTLSTNLLAKPRDSKQCNELLLDTLTGCLLGALIYLPATETAGAAAPKAAGSSQRQQGTDKLIGLIVLSSQSPMMLHTRASSIGVVLDGGYVSKGYGTEALAWLVDWGFRFANLHRIALTVNSFNERAVSAYEKLGFVVEGRARETVYFDRQWYDRLYMSILEQEWEAQRSK
ncbi:acetyltransferase (GNAT) family domain-containing protein [Cordyceps javanica]|uniref:Acetyltransferase (GNAT) family domain-containing protein n=1 Tax=Cordyceps javanica TaxID=43265 RepID=A0A545V5N1_9HYPO|nr:acetyltransferase (GNAT) family domain-containing protein [Cordyceps javanica]TQW08280.1 acetyltransferase (GNAT) family domain-containing protein [Cordyceps javanica]